MGNEILSSDMLVGGLVRSMYSGFQFKDYIEGCWAMYDLNEFLKGFGGYETKVGSKGEKVLSAKMAIDDMPEPNGIEQTTDPRMLRDPEQYYIGYRRLYAGRLMKVVGIYQRSMIDHYKGEGH